MGRYKSNIPGIVCLFVLLTIFVYPSAIFRGMSVFFEKELGGEISSIHCSYTSSHIHLYCQYKLPQKWGRMTWKSRFCAYLLQKLPLAVTAELLLGNDTYLLNYSDDLTLKQGDKTLFTWFDEGGFVANHLPLPLFSPFLSLGSFEGNLSGFVNKEGSGELYTHDCKVHLEKGGFFTIPHLHLALAQKKGALSFGKSQFILDKTPLYTLTPLTLDLSLEKHIRITCQPQPFDVYDEKFNWCYHITSLAWQASYRPYPPKWSDFTATAEGGEVETSKNSIHTFCASFGSKRGIFHLQGPLFSLETTLEKPYAFTLAFLKPFHIAPEKNVRTMEGTLSQHDTNWQFQAECEHGSLQLCFDTIVPLQVKEGCITTDQAKLVLHPSCDNTSNAYVVSGKMALEMLTPWLALPPSLKGSVSIDEASYDQGAWSVKGKLQNGTFAPLHLENMFGDITIANGQTTLQNLETHVHNHQNSYTLFFPLVTYQKELEFEGWIQNNTAELADIKGVATWNDGHWVMTIDPSKTHLLDTPVLKGGCTFSPRGTIASGELTFCTPGCLTGLPVNFFGPSITLLFSENTLSLKSHQCQGDFSWDVDFFCFEGSLWCDKLQCDIHGSLWPLEINAKLANHWLEGLTFQFDGQQLVGIHPYFSLLWDRTHPEKALATLPALALYFVKNKKWELQSIEGEGSHFVQTNDGYQGNITFGPTQLKDLSVKKITLENVDMELKKEGFHLRIERGCSQGLVWKDMVIDTLELNDITFDYPSFDLAGSGSLHLFNAFPKTFETPVTLNPKWFLPYQGTFHFTLYPQGILIDSCKDFFSEGKGIKFDLCHKGFIDWSGHLFMDLKLKPYHLPLKWVELVTLSLDGPIDHPPIVLHKKSKF